MVDDINTDTVDMNLQFKDGSVADNVERLKQKYLERRKQVWVQQQLQVVSHKLSFYDIYATLRVSVTVSVTKASVLYFAMCLFLLTFNQEAR